MHVISDIWVNGRKPWLAIDTPIPAFSWSIQCDERNVRQKSYQIQVSRDESFIDLVWDTDQVETSDSVFIRYDGKALQPFTTYYLRIRTTIERGGMSDWSRVVTFDTAMLSPEDWKASWISAEQQLPPEPCHYFERKFNITKPVKNAKLYISALGMYQAYLNASHIGNSLLTPGWTSYNHQIQYQTYELTEELSVGPHNLKVAVANGWYKGNLGWEGKSEIFGDSRALLAQLNVEYEDGSQDYVCSDPEWLVKTGPILFSEIYHGETYDARLEDVVDGSSLGHPSVLNIGTETLVSQIDEPVRVTEEIQAKHLLTTPQGERVLDFGENLVGWVQFSVDEPEGTEVRLAHAEVLDKDGNFYTENLRSAKQTIAYICKGSGTETHEPLFTFQGFRYVRIDGVSGELDVSNFVAKRIHTDFDETGYFECSNPAINQLQGNIVRGFKGNAVSVPTDCPQRDERLGWTGDAQVFYRTAAFNFNVRSFFRKWLIDLKFDQFEDGGVPAVIPNVLSEGHSSSGWGDAAVIVPWEQFLVFGDMDTLRDQYPSMKKWIEYIRDQGDDELLWNTGFHYGDWLALDAEDGSYVGATPKDLIATAFYAHSTSLVSQAAKVLGYHADSDTYAQLRQAIVQRFREAFIDDHGFLKAKTQTAHVVTLMFDLVTDDTTRKHIAESLVTLIQENRYRLSTGFIGTPYLCHVLSNEGYHDVACRLVTQTEYPSWLYSISQGATTIWEHWDGIKPNGDFWSSDMNSFNHYAYGSVGDWLYRKLAGMDTAPGQPGYRDIIIDPHFDASFSYVRASHDSYYGKVGVEWEFSSTTKEVTLRVEIPPNTSGKVVLRNTETSYVTVDGGLLESTDGLLGTETNERSLEVYLGSGRYVFEYSIL